MKDGDGCISQAAVMNSGVRVLLLLKITLWLVVDVMQWRIVWRTHVAVSAVSAPKFDSSLLLEALTWTPRYATAYTHI